MIRVTVGVESAITSSSRRRRGPHTYSVCGGAFDEDIEPLATESSVCQGDQKLECRATSRLVQRLDHLSAARANFLRQQWRRHRRLSRPSTKTRLPARTGSERNLAAPILSIPSAR